MFAHARVNVLVTHIGLFVRDAGLIKCLEQAEVTHNGRDNGTAGQTAMFIEIDTAHVKNQVAVDNVSAFIDRKTAVGISVVSKADVKTLLNNVTTQAVNMGGAAINVDVKAIGIVVDDAHVGAKGVKNRLGDRRGRAVSAVKSDLHALQREVRARDQMGDITVTTLHIVDSRPDCIALSERDIRLTVNIGLNLLEDRLLHFEAIAVHELDAIIGIRVMRGADHDAAVKTAINRLERNTGSGNYVQHIGISARGNQTGDDSSLKHIA